MNDAMLTPSRTSQAVAMIRAELERPCSPDGDPLAQTTLCAGFPFTPPQRLRPSIAARTKFFDEQVIAAISAGVRQVVICGAGYDDRALRFRTPGVSFIELDHPGTQLDKERRLREMNAEGLALGTIDFSTDDVAAVLASCGHDAMSPSLFICEGLLVYLDAATCDRLLAGLASRAAEGSVLAASLATHSAEFQSEAVVAAANARRRTSAAEPWRTILPEVAHKQMLTTAGWTVTATEDSPAHSTDVSHSTRSVLITAVAGG